MIDMQGVFQLVTIYKYVLLFFPIHMFDCTDYNQLS